MTSTTADHDTADAGRGRGARLRAALAGAGLAAGILAGAAVVDAPSAAAATADSHVALVYSDALRTYATGFGPDPRTAVDNARRTVRDGGARWLAWQERGCVALAQNHIRDGWAYGESRARVRQAARDHAGAGATVTLWGCAAGHRA
ncbi:hypothetical protein [Corynebacterium sphenisci]|uniref:hypothetical protein n=1 Tax=Corynebacterium sphenisci TaxID=191493 RepID=UPI0026E107D5|nr:hypothetical protein [Corynebacterium sphenisci]MDO5730470.1 hypothetical protein [Corynebacterium sphenisci]